MTVVPTSLPTAESTDADALPEVPSRRAIGRRERVAAHALVADIARLHSDALLRTAGRYSACADDAHDAYQRAMELLLAHAGTIDRGKAVSWLHVVVRREAMSIRRAHDRSAPLDDDDVDEALGRLAAQTEERLNSIDLARRASEALASLKESEAQALCLRAQGLSYDEIADAYGWSYTKVNRVVTEGRRAFVDHYRAVERGTVCGETADLLAAYVAGDLKPKLALRVRTHLVRCTGCRSLLHAERQADASLQALLPTGVVAADATSGGWLHDYLLAPLGHVAGRLQPIGDHLVGSKLGLVAASSLALAGSGVAVDQQLDKQPAPKALQTGLTVDRPTPAGSNASAASTVTLPTAIANAEQRSTDLADAAKRKAAAQRRAAARRKAARAAAKRGEFAPAGGEFTPFDGSSARAARSSGNGTVASAPTAPAEVPVTDAPSDASVDVATDAPSASAPSSSSVSDEFGP